MKEERLLSAKEVAKLLDKPVSFVYMNYKNNNFITPVKVGSSLRWKYTEVQQWIKGLS